MGALVFVVLGAGVVSAAGGGRVTVGADVTVAGDTVRLGDVATLEGDEVRGLAAVVLGRAPAAGETRALDGLAVLQAIGRAAGGLDGLTYNVPPVVRVRRASQEVDEPAVRAVIEDFLAETLGTSVADAELRSIEIPGHILLPAGTYRARVIPPAGALLLGHVRLQIEFIIDDRPVKMVGVGADIGLYGPVVVAHRPLVRGETLAQADLTVERRDLSQVPHGVLGVLEDAVDRTARAPIVPYTPIRHEQVAAAAAVHRGDVVLLVAERGPLRITAAGEVREDAAVGEHVRVVNRATQKSLIGRVVDASTVGVEF